jgi:hypothetical protein
MVRIINGEIVAGELTCKLLHCASRFHLSFRCEFAQMTTQGLSKGNRLKVQGRMSSACRKRINVTLFRGRRCNRLSLSPNRPRRTRTASHRPRADLQGCLLLVKMLDLLLAGIGRLSRIPALGVPKRLPVGTPVSG